MSLLMQLRTAWIEYTSLGNLPSERVATSAGHAKCHVLQAKLEAFEAFKIVVAAKVVDNRSYSGMVEDTAKCIAAHGEICVGMSLENMSKTSAVLRGDFVGGTDAEPWHNEVSAECTWSFLDS